MNILPAGIKYYSRERILLAGTKYNSRGPNITRGDHILLAGMKYYSRECINYSRGRKITCGNEILLAGIQYDSRKWIITRGKNITRGKELLLAGNYLLLAGTIYYSRERNIGSIWHQRASLYNQIVTQESDRAGKNCPGPTIFNMFQVHNRANDCTKYE